MFCFLTVCDCFLSLVLLCFQGILTFFHESMHQSCLTLAFYGNSRFCPFPSVYRAVAPFQDLLVQLGTFVYKCLCKHTATDQFSMIWLMLSDFTIVCRKMCSQYSGFWILIHLGDGDVPWGARYKPWATVAISYEITRGDCGLWFCISLCLQNGLLCVFLRYLAVDY